MRGGVGLEDLAALLRLKRVREQRAAAVLSRAALAERRAGEAVARSAAESAGHAARRAQAEAAIYAGLLAGPVAVRRFQGEAGRLAAMAAQAGVLAQRGVAAAQACAAAAGETEAARTVRMAALRDVEAAGLLRGELARREAVRESDREEAETEEVAARPGQADGPGGCRPPPKAEP